MFKYAWSKIAPTAGSYTKSILVAYLVDETAVDGSTADEATFQDRRSLGTAAVPNAYSVAPADGSDFVYGTSEVARVMTGMGDD